MLVEAQVDSHLLWHWWDACVGKRHEGLQEDGRRDEEKSWEDAW